MRALVADDDRPTTVIVENALRVWGLEVDVVHDGAAAWQRMNAIDPPAIAVLDWTMPHLDGLDLCRRVRETWRLASMYILLLTAHDRRNDLLTGLEAGADDYMTKPVDLEELRVRIQVGRRVASLQRDLSRRIAELRRAHDRLKEMASTDALTHLYSRRWWFDMAGNEFARSHHHNNTLTILVTNLNHFKSVNDQFNHKTNDNILKTFTELLHHKYHQTNIIGHIGGEEFALALPETSIAQAQTVASRLTDGCRALSLPAGEESIHWSCSIGLTDARDADADLDAVLRRADAALYQAKRAGRDRWTNAA